MAKTTIKDEYDQFMVFATTQSAANTLTFSTVHLGLNLFQYAGLIISRIEYSVSRPSMVMIVNEADYLEAAITGSDTIDDLALTRPEVYDRLSLNVTEWGTPANAELIYKPIVRDFSNMRGGGMLVPAQDTYLGVDSGDLTGAATVSARVWFRVIELAAGDYIELVQRLRVLTS